MSNCQSKFLNNKKKYNRKILLKYKIRHKLREILYKQKIKLYNINLHNIGKQIFIDALSHRTILGGVYL